MPVAGAGEPSPLRCPRVGRCGAEAPVAPRVLAGSWLQAERLSSGRRVEARSAALRSVNTPAPRASLRLTSASASASLAPSSCTFVPGRGPRMPLRRRVSASGGLLPHLRTPGGFGSERRSEWLTQPLRNPAASRRNRTFVRGRAAPPHQKCDDTHIKIGASRFASILKPGFNTHSATEGAKPDRAGRRKPAAGVRGPLGELTRGKRDTQSAGRLCEYATAWTDGASRLYANPKTSRPPLQGS